MATDFKALWRAKAEGKEIEARSTMPAPVGYPPEWIAMSESTTPAMCAEFFFAQEEAWKFRIKPETVTVNGHELPAPLTREYRGEYWAVQLYGAPCIDHTGFDNDPTDGTLRALENGLCHATKEDAEAWTRALLDWRTCNGTK